MMVSKALTLMSLPRRIRNTEMKRGNPNRKMSTNLKKVMSKTTRRRSSIAEESDGGGTESIAAIMQSIGNNMNDG